MIFCNTRNLSGNLTGVQRYTQEIASRLVDRLKHIAPETPLHGFRGHLWEQFVLPRKLDGHLLWSPSNTGPLSVENQVVSIMDVSPLDHPEWSSRKFSSWYQFLLPRLIHRIRAVITISEFSKQRILHYCPKAADKVHVTLLAADSRFMPIAQDGINEVISQMGIPSPHYIVALGSLEPRKNLKNLLQAWQRIQSKLPTDVWLVLAGAKGKSLVFGDQSFDDLPPRVHLTGHVPDELLPALYSGAMASVYLSYYEGFGLPPLEAMSCGTPVLTSNTSSLPEVVGDAALLVDPLDVEAVSFNLVRMVEDSALRESLRQKGLAQAKRFDWDKTAQQTWEVLKMAENA